VSSGDSSVTEQHRVVLRIPADGAYLSILRTTTAGLAARLDFTLDEIEDLRIAVDEACALLLPQAIPASELLCEFAVGEDVLSVRVTTEAVEPVIPPRDGFAWTVLTALVSSVDAVTTETGTSLTLTRQRESRAAR